MQEPSQNVREIQTGGNLSSAPSLLLVLLHTFTYKKVQRVASFVLFGSTGPLHRHFTLPAVTNM